MVFLLNNNIKVFKKKFKISNVIISIYINRSQYNVVARDLVT